MTTTLQATTYRRPIRPYGGRYVPETLMYALRQLTEQYLQARDDPEFQRQFHGYLRDYVGRPSCSTSPSG